MTKYTTGRVQELNAICSTIEHCVHVFDQITREMDGGHDERLFALEQRLAALRTRVTSLQGQVQCLVFEQSRQKLTRKHVRASPRPVAPALAAAYAAAGA